MKKLPDEQVASFIHSGTLKCHDNGTTLSGAISFISEKELKGLVDFPQELKRPIENENQELQYFVPDSIWLFSPHEIIKHKKLFASWLQAAVIHHADQSDYAKKQKMLQLGRKLLALVYEDYKGITLLSKQLWDNFHFTYHDKVAQHSNNFSNLFESIQDVIDFEKLLPDEFKSVNNKTRRNLDNNIMYYTYLKAVNKLASNYSLLTPPIIIRSRLQQSSSDTCRLEILNVVGKYKFSSIEDIVRKLFNTSTNKKIVDKAKEILIENNALKPQTQIILSEDDFTIYHKVIEVNFLALKEKVNDNLLVTHTLVNLMYHYLHSHYNIIKKTSPLTLEVEIRTRDFSEIEEFKKMLNQCIYYAFDVFITNELFEQFSKSKRGLRIAYENHKNIQTDFKVGFEAFCRKDTLEKQLHTKDEKEKVQKI